MYHCLGLQNVYSGGFAFQSLTIESGALVNVQGSSPLVIRAIAQVTIAGLLNVSGTRGGNSAGDHMAAGGGAGGGALKIEAPNIVITASGAIHADGGDGGDGGGPGQTFTIEAGDGSGGAGRAAGHSGGAGGGSRSAGNAGHGPGASAAGRYAGGVPPGAAGAGYATAGCVLLSDLPTLRAHQQLTGG